MITTEQTQKILELLALESRAPSVAYLNEIIFAYTRTLPWESATRNVCRMATADVAQCPRWPDEFWSLALAQGTAGTCFETNLALFEFLQVLGFEGYLTINNMQAKIGCHTAIVVLLDDRKWLFDAGYPLELVLPIDPERPTETRGKFLDYQVTPNGDGSFEITRSRHPKPYIFTLFDTPISIDAYKRATKDDYRPEGNFNNSVVINKIVDERMVRFSTSPEGVLFESFTADPNGGVATRELLDADGPLASQLAAMFGMPEPILAEALNIVRSAADSN